VARPELPRFEVYVRVAVDGETLAMRVPDLRAADGKDALRRARALYGDLAEVRGIEAVKA
jgi:1,2-phenylacetyl-CoA epoxidase PaaB subunit